MVSVTPPEPEGAAAAGAANPIRTEANPAEAAAAMVMFFMILAFPVYRV